MPDLYTKLISFKSIVNSKKLSADEEMLTLALSSVAQKHLHIAGFG